eukprot:1810833-Rhodomonas_salina.2
MPRLTHLPPLTPLSTTGGEHYFLIRCVQVGAVLEWIRSELLAEDAPDLVDDYQRLRDLDLEPG